MRTAAQIADHIEARHQTGLVMHLTLPELRTLHRSLHEKRSDWGHGHTATGRMVRE